MSIQRSQYIRIRRTIRYRLYSKRSCFQADQNALVKELKFAENAIEVGATEMAMIAAESVFDEEVSEILTAEARALLQVVPGLKDLRFEVARARLKNRK
jgi:glutathionyl-hydroquinone reductase